MFSKRNHNNLLHWQIMVVQVFICHRMWIFGWFIEFLIRFNWWIVVFFICLTSLQFDGQCRSFCRFLFLFLPVSYLLTEWVHWIVDWSAFDFNIEILLFQWLIFTDEMMKYLIYALNIWFYLIRWFIKLRIIYCLRLFI